MSRTGGPSLHPDMRTVGEETDIEDTEDDKEGEGYASSKVKLIYRVFVGVRACVRACVPSHTLARTPSLLSELSLNFNSQILFELSRVFIHQMPATYHAKKFLRATIIISNYHNKLRVR